MQLQKELAKTSSFYDATPDHPTIKLLLLPKLLLQSILQRRLADLLQLAAQYLLISIKIRFLQETGFLITGRYFAFVELFLVL